jgi:hypothetical protein
MVSMSVLTPHKYAVAVQAESGTCASVQYVFCGKSESCVSFNYLFLYLTDLFFGLLLKERCKGIDQR